MNEDYRVTSVPGRHAAESFRIRAAEGTRYVLHLTEFDNSNSGHFRIEDLETLRTITFESLRNETVVSCKVLKDETSPQVLVNVDSELVFNYVSPNDWGRITQTGESWPDIRLGLAEIDPDESIRLYYWHAPQTKTRGLLLWLEPSDQWKERKGKSQTEHNPSL